MNSVRAEREIMSDPDVDGSDSDADATDSDLEIPDEPIVLFDGVCNLCSGFVQFVVPRDPEGRIHFASLQSDVADQLLAEHEPPVEDLESIVLIDGDDCYVKSSAVVRIGEYLGGIYALATVGRLVPRRLRDWAYDVVASRRYDWFGKKDQCMLPTGDVRDRFLE